MRPSQARERREGPGWGGGRSKGRRCWLRWLWATCCLVPSLHPLPQGSILAAAAAPKERAAEGSREGSSKAAPAPSLCHRPHSQGLDAHLSSASLLVLPRHVAVNEVNLLRVSVSWGGQGTSASIWGTSGTRPIPETPSPDPTTHQSRPPSAPWAPEAHGPAPRSGRTTPKIHLLTRNARMGESCSVVLGVPGVHALGVCR